MIKDLKYKARSNLKRHYFLLVLICILSTFLGAEFIGSLFFEESLSNIIIDESRIIIDKVNDKGINSIKSNHSNGTSILGRSRGYLASFLNLIESNEISVKVLKVINSFTKSKSTTLSLFILLIFLLYIIFFIFISSSYNVTLKRIILECRTYDIVPKERFLFLFRVKCFLKVVRTMFITNLYLLLWSFTIFFGIIKYYSYFLVPYILAENPNINSKDAIKLSEKMMFGHKLECFKLALSFLLWDILGFITLGFSRAFYSNPYKYSTYSEYFVYVRNQAKEKNLDNGLLNDYYLYEKASKKSLLKTYKDVNDESFNYDIKTGFIKKILLNYFGINLCKRPVYLKYEENVLSRIKYEQYHSEREGLSYPSRLYVIEEREKNKYLNRINYIRPYNILTLTLLFFIASFIGWIWEVFLHFLWNGKFVNRGVMHGPLLPVYGFGGLFILIFLNKFRDKPILLFFLTTILCGFLEYFGSLYLEMKYDNLWWNYAGYFLNINGRICAEGLFIFGIGGILFVYFLAPLLDDLFKKINKIVLLLVSALLIIMFSIDLFISFNSPNKGKNIDVSIKTDLLPHNINGGNIWKM